MTSKAKSLIRVSFAALALGLALTSLALAADTAGKAPDYSKIPAGHKQALYRIEACCAGCAAGAEEEVNKLAGIDSVDVNNVASFAVVTFDPAKVSDKEISAALGEGGAKETGRGYKGVWSRTKLSDGKVKLALEVHGMTCTDCSNSISQTLAAKPGVSECQAYHESQAAVVVFDPKKTDETALIAGIEKLGFKVESGEAPTERSTARAGA